MSDNDQRKRTLHPLLAFFRDVAAGLVSAAGKTAASALMFALIGAVAGGIFGLTKGSVAMAGVFAGIGFIVGGALALLIAFTPLDF